MFALTDGKPKFYIGKVNGIGYTSEDEKKVIIEDLGDVEIEDKLLKIDKDLKEKAEKLGELQLTYSKSEFMNYLTGKKSIPELEIEKLKQTDVTNKFALLQFDNKILQLERKIDELSK